MIKRWIKILNSLYLLGLVAMVCCGAAFAAETKDMGGWELGGAYNSYYNFSEMDSFKGKVVKITETAPMPNMSPGVILNVKESDDETIDVHVCPTWYRDAESIGLKRGDQVKVRGVWAEINGKDVFMASKIKKGDYYILKVRLTKDGKPFWTMSAEQLAKEQQDKND